jgi:NADH:ubiquinone oxidoreductase subunit 3 (subunit A)
MSFLDLETLTKKYDNLLIQFNQAQIDYDNYLNQVKNLPVTNKDLTTVASAVVVGTDVKNMKVDTLEKCIALCSNDNKCKSATFNPLDYVEPQCLLNYAEGNLIGATDNNSAIIPKEKELVLIIKSLNSQLTDTNEKILEILQTIKTDSNKYKDMYDERKKQFRLLQNNYKRLTLDRIKIKDKINEFETLDEIQNYSNLDTNKNYYRFIVLFIIFIICAYFISKIIIRTNFDNTSNISLKDLFLTVVLLLIAYSLYIYFIQ